MDPPSKTMSASWCQRLLPAIGMNRRLPYRFILVVWIVSSVQYVRLIRVSTLLSTVEMEFIPITTSIQLEQQQSQLQQQKQPDTHEKQQEERFNHTWQVLSNLTRGHLNVTCPHHPDITLTPIHNKYGLPLSSTVRRIPLIIHQTSKSRCLSPMIAQSVQSWQNLDGFSHVFHDDNAVKQLLAEHYTTFPDLKDVMEACVVSKTVMADIWRYIALWEFGGIYTDIDTVPVAFNATTLHPLNDDAYFVVESSHTLSQYFMVASPRHPLMKYAANIAIQGVLYAKDIGQLNAAIKTGPGALHQAFRQFLLDQGIRRKKEKPVTAGAYVGTYNRMISVEGRADDSNSIVFRDTFQKIKKRHEYRAMGMVHYQDTMRYSVGLSCQAAIKRKKNQTPHVVAQ
jgi:mannosyltransferase OCH1-like enzyme